MWRRTDATLFENTNTVGNQERYKYIDEKEQMKNAQSLVVVGRVPEEEGCQ
jgi:hypothetical protein